MILEKTVVTDDKGKKYVECIFDSSNITKTIYFEDNEKFYIFFKRGHGYSYINVDKELYENFENAESQGKFFNQNIKTNPIHQYRFEYKLFESEIKEVESIIENYKKNGENKTNINE
jgi:hypothetical protein